MSENEIKVRLFAVPFTTDKKRIESFNVCGPILFNIIRKELRNMKCPLSDFEIFLDAFLMSVPDEPPCPGLDQQTSSCQDLATHYYTRSLGLGEQDCCVDEVTSGDTVLPIAVYHK